MTLGGMLKEAFRRGRVTDLIGRNLRGKHQELASLLGNKAWAAQGDFASLAKDREFLKGIKALREAEKNRPKPPGLGGKVVKGGAYLGTGALLSEILRQMIAGEE